MENKDDALEQLRALATSLEVPALTPGQIHGALKALVAEAIEQRQHGHDGGTF